MYTLNDFKNCAFNPIKKELDNKLDPMFEILSEVEDADAIIRTIIAIFDPESPYIKDIQDHVERKRAAAIDFGVEDHEGIVAFSNHAYAKAASFYLRSFIRNMDWAIIQANTETFWEYQLRLMAPISYGTAESTVRDKDVMAAIQVKSKLAEDLSLISERIQKHIRIFYGGDEQIIKAVSKSQFSPEAIQNVLKDR